ncbi:MAG: glycosyltransferase [Planctomycetota bacterium]
MQNSGNSPVHIAYTVNEAFVPFAMVSLSSLLEHQTRPCSVHFVHDGDLNPDTQHRIRDFARSFAPVAGLCEPGRNPTVAGLCEPGEIQQPRDPSGLTKASYNPDPSGLTQASYKPVSSGLAEAGYSPANSVEVLFHRLDDAFPREFAKETDWDIAVLYRLALADVLPSNVHRVLYLDGDTLVRSSLDEIFDMDLGETGLGAVAEPHSATKRLNLGPEAKYLNSGVLAIDLECWRTHQTSKQMLAKIMAHPERWHFPDQDILAVQFEGRWQRIPPEFNVTHRFFQRDSIPLPTTEPRIIHFTGQGEKPWQSSRPHPYADEFWTIAEKVRQAGFEMPTRPTKRKKWYQHGPVGWYRKHRETRKARRKSVRLAMQIHRREFFRKRDREITTQFTPELCIRRGPFKGLQYPQAYSHGSTLAAKMLGTYEAELQPTFDRLVSKDYETIIDVGGAEGYYAIGAALAWPSACVIAYELQREAREAIREMARHNGVSERVRIHAECLFGDLYGRRSLIICDIEGSEAELLIHPEALKGFAGSDFVIETHDLFRPGICNQLRDQFSKTHEVSIIQSIPDAERPVIWRLDELSSLSHERQSQTLAERRGGPMQWLVCESKRPFPVRTPHSRRAAS